MSGELRDDNEFGEVPIRPSTDYVYGSAFNNNHNESPRNRNSRNRVNFPDRPDADYPASPNFYREPTQSEYYIPEQPGSSSQSYRLMNQIKPYLDDVLSDSVTQNQEVQRGLQQLRLIQQKIFQNLTDNDDGAEEKGGYLYELQTVIDQIISNANQESLEFKASLHNLKNMNASFLNEQMQMNHGIQEEYEDQEADRIEANTQKFQGRQISGKDSMQSFLQGLSDIEERLFQEIILLREEKLDAINKLNEQRERNHETQRRYKQLEREYNRLLEQKTPSADAYGNRGRVNRDIFHQQTRPRQYSRSKPRQGADLRSKVDQLEARLRNADEQKQILQREVRHMREHADPVSRNLQQEIRRLDQHLATSQRKAAALFPFRSSNNKLASQLNKLRSQNHHLRTEISPNRAFFPDLQKYKAQLPNPQYRGNRHYDEPQPRQPRVSPLAARSRPQRNLYSQEEYPVQRNHNYESDKLDQYRQVLSTIRSMNNR